jgi:hypothetical protein
MHPITFFSQALDVQWMKCRVNMEKNSVTVIIKRKAFNAFFGTNVNKSVYFFMYVFAWPLRYLWMETYLILSPPHHFLESRRSYFTKPYFCDVPRNIRLSLWSDHDFNKCYTKTFEIVNILIVYLLIMLLWVIFICT